MLHTEASVMAGDKSSAPFTEQRNSVSVCIAEVSAEQAVAKVMKEIEKIAKLARQSRICLRKLPP
jgi:hypothetical protein